MTRKEKLMPNNIPKYIRIYDAEGKCFDRFTVVFTGRYAGRRGCDFVSMSENPFSPLGFCQHGDSEQIIDYPSYSHLGKKIRFNDLPPDCQKVVISDYKEIWNL